MNVKNAREIRAGLQSIPKAVIADLEKAGPIARQKAIEVADGVAESLKDYVGYHMNPYPGVTFQHQRHDFAGAVWVIREFPYVEGVPTQLVIQALREAITAELTSRGWQVPNMELTRAADGGKTYLQAQVIVRDPELVEKHRAELNLIKRYFYNPDRKLPPKVYSTSI